jgi:hypothetical protein
MNTTQEILLNRTLTPAQKIVLLGRVEFPDLNQKQICEKLNVSRWTAQRMGKTPSFQGAKSPMVHYAPFKGEKLVKNVYFNPQQFAKMVKKEDKKISLQPEKNYVFAPTPAIKVFKNIYIISTGTDLILSLKDPSVRKGILLNTSSIESAKFEQPTRSIEPDMTAKKNELIPTQHLPALLKKANDFLPVIQQKAPELEVRAICARTLDAACKVIADETQLKYFSIVRAIYPNPGGLGADAKSFGRHNVDEELFLMMLDAIIKQSKYRSYKAAMGLFVPEWKLFTTWLNQFCWLDVLPTVQMPADEAELKRRQKAQRHADLMSRMRTSKGANHD